MHDGNVEHSTRERTCSRLCLSASPIARLWWPATGRSLGRLHPGFGGSWPKGPGASTRSSIPWFRRTDGPTAARYLHVTDPRGDIRDYCLHGRRTHTRWMRCCPYEFRRPTCGSDFNNLLAFRGLVENRLKRAERVVYWAVDFVPDRFGDGALTRAYDALDRLCCCHVDHRVELSHAALDARNRRHGLFQNVSAPKVVPVGAWLGRTLSPRAMANPSVAPCSSDICAPHGTRLGARGCRLSEGSRYSSISTWLGTERPRPNCRRDGRPAGHHRSGDVPRLYRR